MSDVTPSAAQPARDGPIRVFLMDDHEVVRRGVRDLLEAEAGTAAEALARIPALVPDVAVLDVRLPDGDGVSVCRDVRSALPDVACLMLTSFGDDEALFDAIMAGHPDAPAAYPEINNATRPLRAAAAKAGDADRMSLWAGTGFRTATTRPAAEVVDLLTPRRRAHR